MDNYSDKEILKQYSSIMKELKRRKIIRSRNTPVADYAEKIVADRLGFKLSSASCKGYDAIDKDGIKYQIKGRQILDKSSSRQLGVIRNLDKRYFDYLIAVILDSEFNVLEAWKIPHSTIKKYARFSELQNGYILSLRGKILKDSQVESIEKIEERRHKMNKQSKKTDIVYSIRQGMVRPCGGNRGLFATFGIWTRKYGRWIRIHIAGDKNFNITTVTDNPNSVRYHKHLFQRLKKLLIAYDKWPY